MDESYECVGTSREEGGGEEERREKRETDPESKVGKKRTGTGLKKKSRHGRSKKKKPLGNKMMCGCICAQSCPTLCDPMDCIMHGILQARILEWVAFPFSRGSSRPGD